MAGFPGSVLLNGQQYHPTIDKRHPLGTRGYTQDGRVFRYTRNGAVGLTPGMLIQAQASSSDFEAEPLADSTDWAAPTTSSTVVYLSTATSMATADAFVDGYFMVTAGTTAAAVGQMLQIESCPLSNGAAGPGGNPKVFVYSEDKLVTALSTSYTVTLQKNPYDDVIGSIQAAPTAIPLGVCVTDVTAAYYFWLQTWGMACLRVSDTWDTGHYVIYASATGNDRLGEALPTSTLEVDKGAAIVGIAQYIGTDGYAGSAFITLAP